MQNPPPDFHLFDLKIVNFVEMFFINFADTVEVHCRNTVKNADINCLSFLSYNLAFQSPARSFNTKVCLSIFLSVGRSFCPSKL